MEFALRSQKARSASNFDPMANKPTEAETFYSNHMIARPLALKSKEYIETSTNRSEGEGSPGEAWTAGGHRLPKKLRTGRAPEMHSTNSHRITPGLESFGSGATDPGKRNNLVSLPSKRQMNDSRGVSSPQLTTSAVGSGDPLKAPPAGQAYAMPAQVSGKRSAFREVPKRHKMPAQGPQTCANATQLRPRDGRASQVERLRNDFNFSRSEMAVSKQFVPNQPFYDTQHLLTMHSASSIPHQHCSGMARGKESPASSFHPLNRRPPVADFQNHAPGCDLLKNMKSNSGLCKETFAMQFGSFQNGAHAEQFSPLPFAWQQPLVPTSVLPLSPSVPGRQYDNWCAKCNASFRMTSDLVYHMRTQHKRSSDGIPRGGAANTSSTSGISADGFRGKRAEEKLKCERCGETFRERHHLTRHMTSHNSDHE
ncbi:uncharacterized protein LOC119731790 [Patiria miniata]|uniref:C2H2-type domain-containing protein n=1 Tax=Patiria miniata TaxID=46514 RepID=A0A914ABZ4_PATMI|nr:uncharacterized protein LOC119731790 [Patiria miniata]